MGTRDDSEKILRELHVMVSKGQNIPNDPTKVIVDRDKMISLLSELDKNIYKMMEEYELTTQSRDRAEREFTKYAESIVKDANNKAEDIYAASVMYTGEALLRIQNIIHESNESFNKLYADMQHKLKKEEGIVKENQLELKGQLQDLRDTNKYEQIIEERNREISKEKDKQDRNDNSSKKKKSSIYANRMTEIKVNTEYLEKMGYTLEEKSTEEINNSKELDSMENDFLGNDIADEDEDLTFIEDFEKPQPLKIRVDTNADYFRWKEKQNNQKKSEENNEEDEEQNSKESSDAIHNVWKNFIQGKKS